MRTCIKQATAAAAVVHQTERPLYDQWLILVYIYMLRIYLYTLQ